MNWSKSDIRAARKIPLAPLLRQRGLRLRELPGDNHVVEDFHDLVVRDCYWIWKSRHLHVDSQIGVVAVPLNFPKLAS